MAYDIATVRAAATAGPDDFESAGFGNPSAAIAFLTSATADDSAANEKYLAIGFTDFSAERCMSIANDHNEGAAKTERTVHNAAFIYLEDGDNNVIANGAATVTTNGVRITWATVPTNMLVTIIMFDGDWSAKVDTHTTSGTTDASNNYTGASFEPEFMFATTRYNSGDGAPDSDTGAILSFGLCDNDGSATQYCHALFEQDGAATMNDEAETWDDAIAGRVGAYANYEITAFIDDGASSGFTVTTREQNAGRPMNVLMLSSGGNKLHAAWTTTAPASVPSSVDVTLTGMTPTAVLCVVTPSAAFDTAYNASPNVGAHGIGVADGSNAYSIAVAAQDGVGTSNTQSFVDSKLIHMPGHDGDDSANNAIEATSAFASEKLTLSFTNRISTDDILFGMAWGDAAAAAVGHNLLLLGVGT